ncbi:MAG: zf-TFIIB domain-containing protein [Candidatus Eisenbacteria bacterium]|uniref:Zf-TFIIB domain-containing protein n=1 Tax=Eiseniibacteriota bacterium TaxID=2212470 RepID=A0A948S0U6_UNCEI|nr:zf-TFIIB domain-containing protein [Candidatus Eisenbacteria bacterium]MBU1950575.1 zf-TFIIB domain-containing protein [Candidatus Eisenbacteria bacterium]MBU2693227.1 zf-TFIIB domain-containing protein [Candidatus Eisenbacteria bacterium]
MKCPACGLDLRPIATGEITVDVCDGGCGGIWFDRFELDKVDEEHESAGEALLDIPRREGVRIELERKRHCPICDDVIMIQHFMSVKRRVTIDECGGCAGIWLDAGELGMIRELYRTETERRQAADQYFEELFGGDLENIKAESHEKKAKARRFAKALRFLCPSQYIPGKQSWGAF